LPKIAREFDHPIFDHVLIAFQNGLANGRGIQAILLLTEQIPKKLAGRGVESSIARILIDERPEFIGKRKVYRAHGFTLSGMTNIGKYRHMDNPEQQLKQRFNHGKNGIHGRKYGTLFVGSMI
jgi:hypothetical protein